MCNRKGQTIVEYTVIVIIILGVMVAMKDDVKRHIQGRWRSSADDFGEEYDPQYINSFINYSTQVNSQSLVQVQNGQYSPPGGGPQQEGEWTNRIDTSNALETKVGYSQVGD